MKFFFTNLLFVFLTATQINAQSGLKVINYSHDNAGNRTARSIPPGRIGLNDTILSKTKNEAYTIQIFPNPVESFINIQILNFSDTLWQYQVYDLKGMLLEDKTSFTSSEKANFSSFPTGMYILKLKIKEALFQYKIIKQ